MSNRETEVKFRVADVRATRRRLRQLGFRLTHRRCLEDNTLFDTPGRSLRKVRSVLRLRRYGQQWMMTFKGTPAADSFYKTRLEFESLVERPQAVRAIFEHLGFSPVFRYQKYRTRYAPAEEPVRPKTHREAALDETPIGAFLELEGSRAWIDSIARQLGYTRSDYNTFSYGALYLEECRKKNIPPGDMVFSIHSGRKATNSRVRRPRGAARGRSGLSG